jgi:hypothetical protein
MSAYRTRTRTTGARFGYLALLTLLAWGAIALGAAGTSAASTPAAPSHQYLVTFTESGLPAGQDWSVTVGGTTQHSTSSSILFNETNGTYLFTIGSVGGYAVSRNTGTVTVSGSDQTVPVSFAASSTTSQLERVYFGLPLWLWLLILLVIVVLIAAGAAAASRPAPPTAVTTTTVQQPPAVVAPTAPAATAPVNTTRETTVRETTADGRMRESTVREQRTSSSQNTQTYP